MATRLRPHQRLERNWMHGGKITGVCLLTSGPRIEDNFVTPEWSASFTTVCRNHGMFSPDAFRWNDEEATLEEAIVFVKEVEAEYESMGGRL